MASVEVLEGLKRRIIVEVPVETVAATYQKKLNEISKVAKLNGFRQGKVPLPVIEQKFGSKLMQEVSHELIKSTFEEAVAEHKASIVGQPTVEMDAIDKTKSFAYTILFEISPVISLKDFSSVNLTRMKAEINEADIDDMIEKLRKQQASWVKVDRPAELGDRVLIDFEGQQNDQPIKNGSAKNFQLELGSKQFIPGFEEALVGAEPQEERQFNVTFPEDYNDQELKGKLASFKVTVHEVLEPKLPELDDAFVQHIGIHGGVATLRTAVRERMQFEIDRILKSLLQTEVLNKLLELNPLPEVPAVLIDQEIEHLQKEDQNRLAASKINKKKINLPRELYQDAAKRRAMIGLLLSEIIKSHHLKVESDQIDAAIQDMAAIYEDRDAVMKYYYNDKQKLAEIEFSVLTNLAIDKLVEQAVIEDKIISYQEALFLQRGMQ